MPEMQLNVSDFHKITYHKFRSDCDKLVVCFSPQGGGMGSKGFGYNVCEKNGWDYIFVGKARHTNYVSLDPQEFKESISPVIEGRDVIAYGTSAGGNAALFYGGVIGARILSASPRDGRSKLGYTIPKSKTVKSFFPPMIVYDFLQPRDSRTVAEWTDSIYRNSILINVPNSGHKSLARLNQAGTLSYLLKSFILGSVDPRLLRFAEGSVERKYDDAVERYLVRDVQGMVSLLRGDRGVLERPRLLSLYLECLERNSLTDEIEIFRNDLRYVDVSMGALSSSSRRFIKCISA
ncbi:hypothetical protein [Paracoccus aestuariivivens]|uniref:Alpha/beta hydrolase n=1 Tax=Paracoccus aestuariivivens TaxID=1820333 RepID=A0A6L6JGB1_9RHOB|nr:hypothetical protein [Paracoccus aestuariivivens]MTH80345.1 hypothetical protein [Paracoccus aestuariivivens]